MKNLIINDNYQPNGEEIEFIRVVYDKVTDLVWIETPLYEWVDLGLPSGLKWATCNVGAEKPEDFGLYFAWGETDGYNIEITESGIILTDANGNETNKKFNWSDYKLCNGSKETLTKYNYENSNGIVDNLLTLEQVDDAVYQTDNTCRMPTKADFEELTANTTSTWETLNGVNGRRFTSKTNGNSIFVPAAGICDNGYISNFNNGCSLLSSSIHDYMNWYCWYFNFNSSNVGIYGTHRCFGFTVRAVKE